MCMPFTKRFETETDGQVYGFVEEIEKDRDGADVKCCGFTQADEEPAHGLASSPKTPPANQT